MSEQDFVDYYELLQLSSGADSETIERVFHYFAKKFHPDNKDTGDTDRFRLIVEAYRALTDPETRAAYDVKYHEYWNRRWGIVSEASKWSASEPTNGTDFTDDGKHRGNILSILYLQRRHNMKRPGLGDYELARLLRIPIELVEFHLWYLRAKGWVERLDTGQLAITATGVDQVEQTQTQSRNDHMLHAGRILPEES